MGTMPNIPKTFGFKPIGGKPVSLAPKGYGRDWRAIRNRFIADNPLCRHCLDDGHYTPAQQVDHIQPKALGGSDELTNLQSLCIPCHKKKTAKDIARINRGW